MSKIRIPRDIRRVYELIHKVEALAGRIPRSMPLEMDYQPTVYRAGLGDCTIRTSLIKIKWPEVKLQVVLAVSNGKRRVLGLSIECKLGTDETNTRITLTEKDLGQLEGW